MLISPVLRFQRRPSNSSTVRPMSRAILRRRTGEISLGLTIFQEHLKNLLKVGPQLVQRGALGCAHPASRVRIRRTGQCPGRARPRC